MVVEVNVDLNVGLKRIGKNVMRKSKNTRKEREAII